MNNIEFYRNLAEIMAMGTSSKEGAAHVNNDAITVHPYDPTYTPMRPNEESAAINYNTVATLEENAADETEKPEDTRETPAYYFSALKNGLKETVKNNNNELFPQLEILADEFLEDFCNTSMDKNGQPIAENMIAIIKNLVSGSLSSFSASYIKAHKDSSTLDMEAVSKDFNDFVTEKLNDFSKKQIESGEYIEKLKNNEGKTFEDLTEVIKTANANNYITTAETKTIKSKTQEYILNSILNETPEADDLLKLIKPNYQTNTNYTKAQESLKAAKRFEDAGDLIKAQASYKDAQDKIDALLATVPVGDIVKGAAKIEEIKNPPAPEEKPDEPKQPLDDIKTFTDEITKTAQDAAKAYEKITDKDKKAAAKVLLDSINQYKDDLLNAAKDADKAKTDEQKAALNQKLNGYKELITGFVTDFNTIAEVQQSEEKPDDWTHEKATTDITKAYDDAKAVVDAMADGAAKIAANSYLKKIEQAKNAALELLKAEKGDEAAEKALKTKIEGYSGFITDMSGKIDTLAGKKPGSGTNNGGPDNLPPGGSSVDVITPAQFAQQEMNRPEVKAVITDCNNFVTAYNSLTPEQQQTLKPQYDTVQAILANHKKYTDGSLKTVDEMKANTTAITAKAADAKTALNDANALVAANTTTNQQQEIKTACQNALNDSSVQKAIKEANDFLASYAQLTEVLGNQFMDAQKQSELQDALNKANQILADQVKLQNNTPTSKADVETIKNNITTNSKNLASAIQTADDIAAQKRAAATQAKIKEASDAALKDPKVISSYETAKEFIKIYDTLPDALKSTLTTEHINAQNTISNYEQLKNYKSDRVTVVNAVKSTMVGMNSSLINDLKKVKALADTTQMAAELQSLNNDPIVKQVLTNISDFGSKYEKLSDEQKKDPKVIAAFNTIKEASQAFVDKMTQGKFSSSEEIKALHNSIKSSSGKITQALKDIDDVIAAANKPAPEPGEPDPVIKNAIDKAMPMFKGPYDVIRANIKSFMEDYEKLDEYQKDYPEVKEMYDYVQKIQAEFDKVDNYDFKDLNEVAKSMWGTILPSLVSIKRYAEEIKNII